MNDVVGQSWMIWVLHKQLLQHCPGLELPGIGLIGRIGSGGECQRVEDGSFCVIRITSAHGSHCIFVRQHTRSLIGSCRVSEEMRDGLNISSFTLSLRTGSARV